MVSASFPMGWLWIFNKKSPLIPKSKDNSESADHEGD